MKQIRCYFAVCLLLSLLLVSCGRKERVITYDMDTAPQNLDPQSAQDNASRLVIANLFEGLVRLDEEGSIEAAAAESYTVSKDGLRYRFLLREDGRWSDGSPVVADDFVYAFQRLFDPKTGAPDAEQFVCIANGRAVLDGILPASAIGVHAEGTQALVIDLDIPNSRLLQLLTSAAAMPCREEFFLETKGKYGLSDDYILGNGPFMLRSWLQTLLRLKPNNHYREAVMIDQVTLPFLSEQEEDRESRFLSGKTSAAAFLTDISGKFDPTAYQVTEHANTVWGLLFQTEDTVFANEKLRRAFCQTADFNKLADVLPEYFQHTNQMISSAVMLGEDHYRTLAGDAQSIFYDADAADTAYLEALEELECNTLSGLRVILPEGYNHEEYFAYLSQAWQRDLKAYFTIEVLPQADYAARLASGDFDCALVAMTGSYNSPLAVLENFLPEAARNAAGYTPDGYAALLEQAERSADIGQMAKLCREAEELILQSGVFLPFYEQMSYFVQQKNITGICYHFDSGLAEFWRAVIS